MVHLSQGTMQEDSKPGVGKLEVVVDGASKMRIRGGPEEVVPREQEKEGRCFGSRQAGIGSSRRTGSQQ